MSHVRFRYLLLPAALLPILSGIPQCSPTGNGDELVEFTFNFAEGPQNWISLFTNYHVGDEEWVEIESDYRSLPAPLDTARKALFITGHNHPDDLNMYFKRRLGGLQPNLTYRIEFEVEFATNVPAGCAGIGGPPGEGVTVHADASRYEPEQVVDESVPPPYYRLNLVTDSSDQWYENTKLGDITNSRSSEDEWVFELKTLKGDPSYPMVRTDQEGRLWVIVGTRSGFEGITSLYYAKIVITLRRE